MKKTIFKGQLSALSVLLVSTISIAAQARVKPIVFINELPARASTIEPPNRLCVTKDTDSGTAIKNDLSVRNFLGPKLKSITITQVTNFETRDHFEQAKKAIIEMMAKSPKTLYRHEPWANAVHADFVGQINYSDGKKGELRCTYGYMCLQDHDGKHWWMRMASPEDLNELPVE